MLTSDFSHSNLLLKELAMCQDAESKGINGKGVRWSQEAIALELSLIYNKDTHSCENGRVKP